MVLSRHPANSYMYFHPSTTPPSLPPTTSSSSMISINPSGERGSQFSIASAWEISERNRNGGYLFRNNKLLKPSLLSSSSSNKNDHRRFSRSCDELDNLENNNYSNSVASSEYSKAFPPTPFGKRKPRIIARSPLVASPMLFRQSPRNLRSKSNAAHGFRNGGGLCRPLQYSVTLAPTTTLTIPIGHQHQQLHQHQKNHNYG